MFNQIQQTMLRVDYKNPKGYAMVPAVGGGKVKVWLCHANLELWAEIQHTTDSEGNKVARLCGFFADNEHLKRCRKGNMRLDGCHYHFNSFFKVSHATVKELTMMGAKVSFFYKEVPCSH